MAKRHLVKSVDYFVRSLRARHSTSWCSTCRTVCCRTDSTDYDLDDPLDDAPTGTTTYSSYAAPAQNNKYNTAQASSGQSQVQSQAQSQAQSTQSSYYATPAPAHTPRLVSTDGERVTWELNMAQPLGWECYQFAGGDTTVAEIYPGYSRRPTLRSLSVTRS